MYKGNFTTGQPVFVVFDSLCKFTNLETVKDADLQTAIIVYP